MTAIPDHCPYRAGDRVQMHGFPGEHVHAGRHPNDPAVTGWRGVVAEGGYLGATLLVVQTDDGHRWSEYWGSIDRDLTPCHDARCGCCPHPGGVCQPDQADSGRARQTAAAMAAWWRDGAGRAEPEQLGQLALFASLT